MYFMNKRIIIIILSFMLVAGVSAKEPVKLRDFEAEFSIGVSSPLFRITDYGRWFGFDYGGEIRYNLRSCPFSTGVFLESYRPSRFFPSEKNDGLHNNGGGLYGILAEYDYKRGKKFSPFASLGFGLGNMHILDNPSKCTPALRVRIGMELCYHLRISATGTFTKRDLCGYTISLGFVFGGRPQNK